jgi:hypothetical protein
MSLNPALQNGGSNGSNHKKKKFKTVATLSKELDKSNQRIAYLEGLLKANNIAFD